MMTKGLYAYIDTQDGNIVYIGKDSYINRHKRHNYHSNPNRKEEQVINNVIQNNPDRYSYQELVRIPKTAPHKELNDLEKLFISIYNPKFNFTVGGDGCSLINKQDHYCYRSDVPDGLELVKLTEKYSNKKVADYYGVHESTIAERVTKYRGVKYTRGEKQARKDVPYGEALYNEHIQSKLNFKELAKKYKCSDSLIQHRINDYKKQHGIALINPRVNLPEPYDLFLEWQSGISFKKLGEKYNCSSTSVLRQVDKYRKSIT